MGYLSSRGPMLPISMSSTPQIVGHQIPRVLSSASQRPFMLTSRVSFNSYVPLSLVQSSQLSRAKDFDLADALSAPSNLDRAKHTWSGLFMPNTPATPNQSKYLWEVETLGSQV